MIVIVETYEDGVLVGSREVEVPDPTPEEANRQTIEGQAATALANNTTYLAIPTPTQAQAIAQVEALTRQNNRLIRLVLQRFDATD